MIKSNEVRKFLSEALARLDEPIFSEPLNGKMTIQKLKKLRTFITDVAFVPGLEEKTKPLRDGILFQIDRESIVLQADVGIELREKGSEPC